MSAEQQGLIAAGITSTYCLGLRLLLLPTLLLLLVPLHDARSQAVVRHQQHVHWLVGHGRAPHALLQLQPAADGTALIREAISSYHRVTHHSSCDGADEVWWRLIAAAVMPGWAAQLLLLLPGSGLGCQLLQCLYQLAASQSTAH